MASRPAFLPARACVLHAGHGPPDPPVQPRRPSLQSSTGQIRPPSITPPPATTALSFFSPYAEALDPDPIQSSSGHAGEGQHLPWRPRLARPWPWLATYLPRGWLARVSVASNSGGRLRLLPQPPRTDARHLRRGRPTRRPPWKLPSRSTMGTPWTSLCFLPLLCRQSLFSNFICSSIHGGHVQESEEERQRGAGAGGDRRDAGCVRRRPQALRKAVSRCQRCLLAWLLH
nr:uncharacterized protein LOC109745135 isoform X2 [Aegilops tauschii subsp. strangulata]